MTKKTDENLHAGHRKSMQEKFLASSPDSIPDHELLEQVLFFSIPRRNTNEIAHELKNRYASFHRIFDADYYDLMQTEGIGDYSAYLIKLIRACTQRYNDSKAILTRKIATTEEAGQYFVDKLANEKYERSLVLMLDNRDRIIDCQCFAEGVVNYLPVCMRTMYQIAFSCNAAGIYIAHNHPSGSAVPSNDDLHLTQEIREICSKLNLDFKDHILVAGNQFVSVVDFLDNNKRR